MAVNSLSVIYIPKRSGEPIAESTQVTINIDLDRMSQPTTSHGRTSPISLSANAENLSFDIARARQQHNTLRRLLSVKLEEDEKLGRSPVVKVPNQLSGMPGPRLLVLGSDVCAELRRRRDMQTTGVPNIPSSLPPRDCYHPRWNHARQQLASLPPDGFKQMAVNVCHELERRVQCSKPDVDGPESNLTPRPSQSVLVPPRTTNSSPVSPSRPAVGAEGRTPPTRLVSDSIVTQTPTISCSFKRKPVPSRSVSTTGHDIPSVQGSDRIRTLQVELDQLREKLAQAEIVALAKDHEINLLKEALAVAEQQNGRSREDPPPPYRRR
ncbi:hypothetical protein K470DRAFT_272890 [Piedraia hortae CBS 480.64]|uniref:Uncharacterized protein n=1 Tax=Piedraia hortae CBS 480.64 TaxID=1314780 RepID=A0A6A7BTS4_9PEZI|nr:hypothetical protein K470DRAFT_272890 [Piedraia hortae CBS 480.64]